MTAPARGAAHPALALADAGWPETRLGEALAELGRVHRLAPRPVAVGAPPVPGGPGLAEWVEDAARWMGLETEPVVVPYPEAAEFARRAAPAIVRIAGPGEPFYCLLVRGGRRHVVLLTPTLGRCRVSTAAFVDALVAPAEAPVAHECDGIMAAVDAPPRRAARVRRALLGQLLPHAAVGGCWLVRPGTEAGAAAQLGLAGLVRRVAGVLAAHAALYTLWLAAWWLVGWMALTDRLTTEGLTPWALLVAAVVPLRLLRTGAAGLLAIRLGTRLRARLLSGALKLHPDKIRHLGAGSLLGRVLETEQLETLALSGGLAAATAGLELGAAALLLWHGAGGAPHVAALLAWVLVAAALGGRYARRVRRWARHRLELTNALVEELGGHRTRLVQEPVAERSERADAGLARYTALSAPMDTSTALLRGVVARGWLLIGLVALLPTLVREGGSTAELAVALGGVLLAYRALRGLAGGAEQLAQAWVAWQQAAPFAAAADEPEAVGHPAVARAVRRPPAVAPLDDDAASHTPLLDARAVRVQYPGRPAATLDGVTLALRRGDRVLLEGESGGGKSTLAAVLAASRPASAGLLLLDGLDPPTVGDARWRRRVALVPQFHENHVLMGTFAFNALMGRGWPPAPADLAEAEAVCRAVGLGPLLDRMPAGMMQVVGETGWQLSHGERSRLFLARAVLQRPDVLVLDESFAALDPETLATVSAYVTAYDGAVVLVAHP